MSQLTEKSKERSPLATRRRRDEGQLVMPEPTRQITSDGERKKLEARAEIQKKWNEGVQAFVLVEAPGPFVPYVSRDQTRLAARNKLKAVFAHHSGTDDSSESKLVEELFLKAFLRALHTVGPDTNPFRVGFLLPTWWAERSSEEKFLIQAVASRISDVELLDGLFKSLSARGMPLPKTPRRQIDFVSGKLAIRAILDLPATDQIPEADAWENDGETLPTEQNQNDYSLLKDFFDAHNVPEGEREARAEEILLVVTRVTNSRPQLKLPEKAPKLYAERPTGQSIIDFLRDPAGWGPYIEAGVLTRPYLRRLDRKAYDALNTWLQHHSLPGDMSLPTKSAMINRAAEQMAAAVGSTTALVPRIGKTLEARNRRRPAP